MATPENTASIFVENLQRLCTALEMSVDALAESSGVDLETLRMLLSGSRQPGIDELASLGRALDVDPSDLLEPGTDEDMFWSDG